MTAKRRTVLSFPLSSALQIPPQILAKQVKSLQRIARGGKDVEAVLVKRNHLHMRYCAK